jgi:hypothetical protein
MKKATLLFTVVLCTVLLISCAKSNPYKTIDPEIPYNTINSENPYKIFDPEGVIVKGYLGMAADQLQLADNEMKHEPTDKSDGYTKTTESYKLFCDLSNGKVSVAYYIFTYKTLDKYVNETVNCYYAIKNILGPDADGKIKDEEFTTQYLKKAKDNLTGALAWNVKKYGVIVGMVYTYGNSGVISIVIGKPKGTN